MTLDNRRGMGGGDFVLISSCFAGENFEGGKLCHPWESQSPNCLPHILTYKPILGVFQKGLRVVWGSFEPPYPPWGGEGGLEKRLPNRCQSKNSIELGLNSRWSLRGIGGT